MSGYDQHNLVDLWQIVGVIFDGPSDDTPEIDVTNFSARGLINCLNYLMRRTRDCNSVFRLTGSRYRVIVPSLDRMTRMLVAGEIVGVIWLNIPALPLLGFFVDEPDRITISFARGEWNALSVIALYDLIHIMTDYSPNANVILNGNQYSDRELDLFNTSWLAYRGMES